MATDPTMDQGGIDLRADLVQLEYRDAPTTLNVLLDHFSYVDPDPNPGLQDRYWSTMAFSVLHGANRTSFRIEADGTVLRLLRDGQDISDRLQFSGSPTASEFHILLDTKGLLGEGTDLIEGDLVVDTVAWLNSTGPLGATADRAPDSGTGINHAFLRSDVDDRLVGPYQAAGASIAFGDGPDAPLHAASWVTGTGPEMPDRPTQPGLWYAQQNETGLAWQRLSTQAGGQDDRTVIAVSGPQVALLATSATRLQLHLWNGTAWSQESPTATSLRAGTAADLSWEGGRMVLSMPIATGHAILERKAGNWTQIHAIGGSASLELAQAGDGTVQAAWSKGGQLHVASEADDWRIRDIADVYEEGRSVSDDGSFGFAVDLAGDPAFVWDAGDRDPRFLWEREGGAVRDGLPACPGGNPCLQMQLAAGAAGDMAVVGEYGSTGDAWVRWLDGDVQLIDLGNLHNHVALAVADDGRLAFAGRQGNGGNALDFLIVHPPQRPLPDPLWSPPPPDAPGSASTPGLAFGATLAALAVALVRRR